MLVNTSYFVLSLLPLFVVAAILGGYGLRIPGHDAGGGRALFRSHPRARLLHLPLRKYLLSTLPHQEVSVLSTQPHPGVCKTSVP